MTSSKAIVCLAVLAVSANAGPLRTGTRSAPLVAVVYWLNGHAQMRVGQAPSSELRTFEWLPVGARIETQPDSGVTVALVNGRRYELGAGSAAVVEAARIWTVRGSVRELDPVPPLFGLPAIAEEEHPGRAMGAIRIRSRSIDDLSPSSVSLASRTVLSFAPEPTSDRYRIEVFSEEGHLVFREDTRATCVQVPPAALQPATRYHWIVQTLAGPGMRAAADFTTLSQDDERHRSEWLAKVDSSADPRLIALAAEFDRRLGLLSEACARLGMAITRSGDDPGLRERVRDTEQRLGACGVGSR